jgi:hypothetical protein
MAIRTAKNILEKLTDKFSAYLQALIGIEDDFQFLKTPGHFINSYENTLLELKRRNCFNSDMQEELTLIKALINNENYLRKKFIDENKKYLTPDFIKLLNLENKIVFNFDFQNNKENLDLLILFPDDHKTNENNIETNFNETENTTFNFDEKQENNSNKKIIKNLMNQINELDIKLKRRDKELSDIQIKYKNIENNFQDINKDMKNIYTIFDEISDIFNLELSSKEQQISELTQRLENINKQNKENNIDNIYQDEINKYKIKIN